MSKEEILNYLKQRLKHAKNREQQFAIPEGKRKEYTSHGGRQAGYRKARVVCLEDFIEMLLLNNNK